MSFPDLVRLAPTPLIELDAHEMIVDANQAAIAMGFTLGVSITDFCHVVSEPFIEWVRYQPASHLYRFNVGGAEKRCRVLLQEQDTNGQIDNSLQARYLWIVDQSESLVLAEKLRRFKSPDSKKNRQINQLSITALGYAELLDVVMEDNSNLSADKFYTIRNYQSEISSCLRDIHQLVEGGPAKTQRGQVLVAERHSALKELVSELLRAEGYKVDAFSDVAAAIAYCRLNGDTLQKAVVDEALLDADGKSLIAHLKDLQPDLRIVALVESEAGIESGGVPKPLDFQVLLEAMAD